MGKKLVRLSLIIIGLVVVLFFGLWYMHEHTNYGFAEMYRQDKCLDNGRQWDKENKRCIGGKYGI